MSFASAMLPVGLESFDGVHLATIKWPQGRKSQEAFESWWITTE